MMFSGEGKGFGLSHELWLLFSYGVKKGSEQRFRNINFHQLSPSEKQADSIFCACIYVR